MFDIACCFWQTHSERLSVICSLQNWGLVCWETTSGVKSGVLCHSSSVLLRTRGTLKSKSRQQLDGCLGAITVWAARHHSNRPMHHSLSPLAAWKPHHCTGAWRRRHAGTCLSETSEGRQWAEAALCDWYVVRNQQSFIDQAIDQWQDYCNARLNAKSKHWTFAIMFLRNSHYETSKAYTLLMILTNWLMFRFTR